MPAGGETLLTHKKKATRARKEAGRSRCAEIFSPFSKGESFSSSFSSLSGLVNSDEGEKRGKEAVGSESDSWHAESVKLRVVFVT